LRNYAQAGSSYTLKCMFESQYLST